MGLVALLGKRKGHEKSSWPSYWAPYSHLYKSSFCSNVPSSCLIMHLLSVFILLSDVLSGCGAEPMSVRCLLPSPQSHSAGKFDLAKGLVWSILSLSFRPPGHVHISNWPSLYFTFLRIQRTSGLCFLKRMAKFTRQLFLWIELPLSSPLRSSLRRQGFVTAIHLLFPVSGPCATYRGMEAEGWGWEGTTERKRCCSFQGLIIEQKAQPHTINHKAR